MDYPMWQRSALLVRFEVMRSTNEDLNLHQLELVAKIGKAIQASRPRISHPNWSHAYTCELLLNTQIKGVLSHLV